MKNFKFTFGRPHKAPWVTRVSRGWPKDTPSFIRTRLHGAAGRAKKLGVPFTLSPADLPPIPEVCPVLGIRLVVGGGRAAPSLDRINPALGYVPGNVQWLSFQANGMKSDATPEALRKFAAWVLATFPESE